MSPNRPVHFWKLREIATSPGGLLIACVFSLVISSCSSSNSLSFAFRDSVVADLKIRFQFGYPGAVRVSSTGNYIVLDEENKRAVILWPDRAEERTLSLRGTESTSALYPAAFTLSMSKFITVADLTSRSLLNFNDIFE